MNAFNQSGQKVGRQVNVGVDGDRYVYPISVETLETLTLFLRANPPIDGVVLHLLRQIADQLKEGRSILLVPPGR